MKQVALELGPLTIHWYGVFFALGILAGLWTASRRGLRDNLKPDSILDIGPWLIVGAVLGARALYVITYWEESFAGKPFTEVFMIQKGGLVYYGGLMGAIVSCLTYLRIKQLPLWKFADALAPSIALGHAFGRIGCLMNGCCFGTTCSQPWAIHFPEWHMTQGAGVHPTQIYEALLNMGLYLGLAKCYQRRSFEGQIFALYLIGYGVLRALVETFRGDYETRSFGILSQGQLISVPILAVGITLFFRLRSSASKTNSTET